MTLKKNSFEAGTNGATVTGSSTATSGDQLTISAGTGGTITYSNAQPMHGSMGALLAAGTTSSCVVLYGSYTATSIAARRYTYYPSLPTGSNATLLGIFNQSSTNIVRVDLNTSGNILVYTPAGLVFTSSVTLPATNQYRVELAVTPGTTTSNGFINFAVYSGDSATAITGTTYTSSTANLGTTAVLQVQFGRAVASSASFTDYLDDPAANDGTTTFIGPPSLPPLASFSTAIAGHTLKVDGSSSSGQGGATITGYAWTFGDGGTASGSTATYRYPTAGTYTVTLTVTDSNSLTGSTTHSVSPVDGGLSAYFVSLSATTGQTPTSGSVLSVISDTDPTTFTASSGSPTALPITGILGALQPPASGQPFVVTLVIDRVSSASGSLAAQVFDADGTTQRSSVTAVLVPDMAASGGTGTATSGSVVGTAELIFPASDVTSMSASGWDMATLSIQETAA